MKKYDGDFVFSCVLGSFLGLMWLALIMMMFATVLKPYPHP
jgi:hypothetical protein